ncbi:MAG TPA: dTDP-4-dehydrorhamnose reductase [Anaerolineales bacterium]
MRILLLGKKGQLGWELARVLPPLGDLVALDYPEIDLANQDLMRELIRQAAPELIVNATAYTAVDEAEAHPELAYAINGSGVGVLAEESRALGAVLVHYSTDYVFDGAKGQPYIESDVPNPLNVYGKSKRAGEEAIRAVGGAYLILRTAWVYSLRGDSFVNKVLRWARQNETLRVVDDQVSNPTWARMLAEITAQLLARGQETVRERKGLYHLAGRGYASRLEWAQEILALDAQSPEQSVKQMLPASTGDFPTPARRPLFSALDCTRFEQSFGLMLPDWRDALRLAMTQE